MPTYIWLLEFTAEGIDAIEDVARRDEEGRDLLASMDVELVDNYYTLGQYDEVAIVEAPDDETATQAALRIGAEGNVTTETLRAFDEAEFHDLVSELPD